MKKAIIIVAIICSLAGCAKGGGITVKPDQIDWAQTSKYYHEYVAGFIAPVGATIAAIAVPEAAPLIALASRQVANLDSLIAAKADNAAIAQQAALVQKAIQDVNATVGKKK